MNINSLSVLLGCAGLVIGSLGLVAQDIHGPQQHSQAEAREHPRAASWPPHPIVAHVEFHDEMLELISRGPAPPRSREARVQDEPQTVGQRQSQEGGPQALPEIRFIRPVRGPRRSRFVEIEFVDANGDSHWRRYPVNQPMFATDEDGRVVEADQSAMQSYGYSPRRSRRGHHRRWR